jgi:hypothetical protein
MGWRRPHSEELQRFHRLTLMFALSLGLGQGTAIHGQSLETSDEKPPFDTNWDFSLLPSSTPPDNAPQSDRRSAAPGFVLGGQVVDDGTGERIPRFTVMGGNEDWPYFFHMILEGIPRQPREESVFHLMMNRLENKKDQDRKTPFWRNGCVASCSNGFFLFQFPGAFDPSNRPMLRIEAEGCEPVDTQPLDAPIKNLLIRLKRGDGPNGIILLPDGQPAEGATVAYAGSGELVNLCSNVLTLFNSNTPADGIIRVAGRDGRFAFPIRSQGRTLFVAHRAGWAQVVVDRGGSDLKLRLQPWAIVTGTLVDARGSPASGVELTATMPIGDRQRGEPEALLPACATTDARGRFLLRDLPPGRLELHRRIPYAPGVWTILKQTWFIAKPGITNDLGKVYYDSPPPPPLAEQIRERLEPGH